MRNPQEKDFSVYNFSEEDAAVERSTKCAMLKFWKRRENPKGGAAAADETVDFLEAFGGSKRSNHSERVGAVCMVIDRSNSNCASSGHVSHEMSVSEQKTAAHASDPTSSVEEILVSSSGVLDHICQRSQGNMIHNCLAEGPIEMTASSLSSHVTGNIHCSCVLPEPASNITQSDASSDLSEGHMPCSSSSHSSEDGEDRGSLDPQDLAAQTGAEDKDVDAAVIVTPDYLVYHDELYAESQLTFSVDSIRIECFDANRGEGPLILDWAIADLLLIGCSWNGNIETAFIEVQSKETDSNVNTLENEHDLSGIMRVMFTVCGSQWSRKEKKIMLLAPSYIDLWKSGLDIRGNKFSSNLEESIPFYPRQQLHDFEEAMEDVVYPHGDPDAVSISKRDVELLQPETFINDTIIDFYVKYLKDKIQINERNRFHFFNSFFFRKLVDLDKDPKNIGDGRAAFLRVRKWTRKVNIFEKDYIFIPVNFNLHWSLLVICHPGEVMSLQNEEIDKALRVPCIVHLDSIKGSHSGLRGLIQSYLFEEWKERHMESVEDASSNFLNLRFVPLELPQQENYYDCGLFLLHYVELFLEAAPVNFNPFKITTFSNFLSVDWFVPSEASFKRYLIRNLLYELLGSKKQSDLLDLCNGDRLSPHFPNDDHAMNVVALLPQPDLAPATVVNDASTHIEDDRIELDMFKGSSIAPNIKDDQLDQQLLDSKANEGNSNHKMNVNFEPVASFSALKCAMPTIMEDEEDLVHSEIWGTCRTLNGNSDETCSTSHLTGEPVGHEMLGSPEGLMQIEEDHAICGFLSEPPGSGYLKESEKTLFSTDNSDHLPCGNSEPLYNSDEEKNILISSDGSEHPSAKKDISHSEEDMNGLCIEVAQVPEPCNPLEVIQDDEKLELLNITIPDISETCTVQLVTTIPESPETRMKCLQVGENTAIAFSRQDGVENINSNLPEACDVVLDSPDCNLKPANLTEETPGFSAVGDDESPGVSASTNRCHSVLRIESSNDVSDNDNNKATSEDLVVLEEGRRRKRRKVHHSGIPRKQTRSVTRTISF